MLEKKAGKPMISVIMPCYNDEKYVALAIESVINQTYTDYEFYVIDNGSTDRSLEIINQYQKYITKIIHIEKNTFISCWEPYQCCSGNYIATMSSNDIWLPDKLEKQIEALRQNESCVACFTWAEDMQEDSKPIHGNTVFKTQNMLRSEWLYKLLTAGNCLAYFSALVEAEIWRSVWMPNAYYQLGDYLLWIKILFQYDIFVVPEVLLYMRKLDKSMSSRSLKSANRTANETCAIFRWTFENIPDDLYKETFGKYFYDLNACTPEELLCEKLMTLQRFTELNMYCGEIFLYWYYTYYEKMWSVLEKKYNITYFSLLDELGSIGLRATVEAFTKSKKGVEETKNQLIGKLIQKTDYEYVKEYFDEEEREQVQLLKESYEMILTLDGKILATQEVFQLAKDILQGMENISLILQKYGLVFEKKEYCELQELLSDKTQLCEKDADIFALCYQRFLEKMAL